MPYLMNEATSQREWHEPELFGTVINDELVTHNGLIIVGTAQEMATYPGLTVGLPDTITPTVRAAKLIVEANGYTVTSTPLDPLHPARARVAGA